MACRISAMEEFATAHEAAAGATRWQTEALATLFNTGCAYAAPLSCTPSTRRNPRVARLPEGKVRRSTAVPRSGRPSGRAPPSPRAKLRVVCRAAGRCRRGGRERDLAATLPATERRQIRQKRNTSATA